MAPDRTGQRQLISSLSPVQPLLHPAAAAAAALQGGGLLLHAAATAVLALLPKLLRRPCVHGFSQVGADTLHATANSSLWHLSCARGLSNSLVRYMGRLPAGSCHASRQAPGLLGKRLPACASS